MRAPNSADELAAPSRGVAESTRHSVPCANSGPDSSTLSVAAGLARRPERTARRLCSLGAEIGRIVVGVSKGAAVEVRSSFCRHRMEQEPGAAPLEA
jgi:hypothetical protein